MLCIRSAIDVSVWDDERTEVIPRPPQRGWHPDPALVVVVPPDLVRGPLAHDVAAGDEEGVVVGRSRAPAHRVGKRRT